MYEIELEQFQGPLDLLLSLIEGQELNISQVSLAQVTDQYLAYLEKSQDIGATELADFLLVATKLLMIKSKMLLPQMADDEDDGAEQLEAQLKMYKDYLNASVLIEKMIAGKNFLFSRERAIFNFQPTFSPPKDLQTIELKNYLEEILKRIDYVISLPQKALEKITSLKEKLADIKKVLSLNSKINFSGIISESASKFDKVISFMALLELIKAQEVAVNQKGIFDDIYIEKV